MVAIVIDHVTKRFGSFAAVNDLDVSFGDGKVTCLLGPSGCGKTTLMRIIAGLETPTSGRVLFGSRDVTGLPPRKRNISMVFQYPVMYPTLSVAENIALPIKSDSSVSPAERSRRVDEVLDVLGMREAANAYIEDLDAGHRQKVSVGRAVARHSDIVLLDEPTTNVEINTKLMLIRAFKEVAIRLKQTIVYVTHDQTEAMTLADRIALMHSGRIIQYDEPRRLYNDPTTDFGGWFLGNPGMNFVRATLSNGQIEAPILAAPLKAPADLLSDKLAVGIRPEQVRMHGAAVPGSLGGVLVDQAIGIAGRFLTKVAIGDIVVKVKTDGRPPAKLGEPVHLVFPPERVMLFSDGRRVT